MRTERLSLIRQLGELRGSNVICYLTSDREPYGAQIASDVLSVFYRHLRALGVGEKISLFLFSNGGTLDTPWPLVGLVREFCEDFEVIVPSKALSAATLVALGADRIVMGPASFLSPVDPSARIEGKGQKHQIEVEDVFGFIDFVKEQVGLKGEAALSETLQELVAQVDPVMLGSINRTSYLIRRLAKRLLLLHMDDRREEDKLRIDLIVENLTQRLYSHRHLIYRWEARDHLGFGDLIEFASGDTQQAMDALFLQYVSLLGAGKPFQPTEYFDAGSLEPGVSERASIDRAVIESASNLDVFQTVVSISADSQSGEIRFTEVESGWREIDHEP